MKKLFLQPKAIFFGTLIMLSNVAILQANPPLPSFEFFQTSIVEPSDLSISFTGNSLFVVCDNGRVYEIGFDGATIRQLHFSRATNPNTANPLDERLDLEGITIDPINRHIFVANERSLRISKLDEDGHYISSFVIPNTVLSPADVNDGVEGISLHNDTFFIVNQRNPTVLITYDRINSVWSPQIPLTFVRSASAVSFDAYDNTLWIICSELRRLFQTTTEGVLLNVLNISFISLPEGVWVDRNENVAWICCDNTGRLYRVSLDALVAHEPPTYLASWNFRNPTSSMSNNIWGATSGISTEGTNLQFFYAMGLQATLGHSGRVAVNVSNSGSAQNGGWFPRVNPEDNMPSAPITAQNSAGWVFTFSTTGFENITFSASQATTGSGPRDFALAYRIGTSGTWTAFDRIHSAANTPITNLGNAIDGQALTPTFVNVPLPATVDDQAVVQLKVFIASAINKGGSPLVANNGNTSINYVVFNGTEREDNTTHILSDRQKSLAIHIFPNPVTHVLHIIHEWQSGDVVELFDMNGRRVFSTPVDMQHIASLQSETFTIDMTPFPAGNYILRIGNRVEIVVKH